MARHKTQKPIEMFSSKGVPSCPSFLDREAKAEWRRTTLLLKTMGLLTKVDRGAMAAYCEAWSEFVALSAQVRKSGHVSVTDNGNEVQHPLVGAKNKASERMLKVACQFGMTPSARTKITTENKKTDPLLDFLGGKSCG